MPAEKAAFPMVDESGLSLEEFFAVKATGTVRKESEPLVLGEVLR